MSVYPSPSDYPKFDFGSEVAWCEGRFASVLNMHSRIDVAQVLDEAIELFQGLRRHSGRRLTFDAAQRDALLKALTSARLAVEINIAGDERELLIDAVRSLQDLVAYFGMPEEHRSLSSDHVADLIDQMRLGQNVARNIVLLDNLLRRALRRSSSERGAGR